jgi:hypothetical protein
MEHRIHRSKIFILLGTIAVIGSFSFDDARAMEDEQLEKSIRAPLNSDPIAEDYDDKPLDDKYEKAVKICRSHIDRPTIRLTSNNEIEMSGSYEDAMKMCGADNYRLYPTTIWGIGLCNMIDSASYQMLISAELHHVAGDMMHIAELENDKDYREKVESAMRYEFQKTWFEEKTKGKHYSTRELKELKIPDEKFPNNDDEMCDAFIKMIGFFKRWDELQKTGEEYDQINFYRQITEKYKENYFSPVYSYESYAKVSLLKYRKQRKLSLFWHPTYYSVYDSTAYSKAKAREQEASDIWVRNFMSQQQAAAMEAQERGREGIVRRFNLQRHRYCTPLNCQFLERSCTGGDQNLY